MRILLDLLMSSELNWLLLDAAHFAGGPLQVWLRPDVVQFGECMVSGRNTLVSKVTWTKVLTPKIPDPMVS